MPGRRRSVPSLPENGIFPRERITAAHAGRQLGGGRSDQPADSTLWRVDRFVEELGQVRAALGLEQVHILGHSWGTMLATDYLLTRPTGVVSPSAAPDTMPTARTASPPPAGWSGGVVDGLSGEAAAITAEGLRVEVPALGARIYVVADRRAE